MNNQRPHGILPPESSRLKRKHSESSLLPAKSPPPVTVAASMITKTSTGSKGIEITSSNKLLAGYMAYQFLTKGTLLGQKFDATRSEMPAKGKLWPVKSSGSYEEVTSLLMMKSDGGCHIPGIVNPEQLSRWIEM